MAYLIFVFLLFLPFGLQCEAGEVYGSIKLNQQPFKGSLTMSDGRSIQIQDGNYRIFLPPGTHSVTLRNGGEWQKQIQSSPGPLRQDINLP